MTAKQLSPLVSVVIVNWNGLDDTKECLGYLKEQTYKNIEVIVVDNGSSDGSAEYLKNLRDTKLVQNPKNLGFTGGHIAGYQASSGDYVLLLNNDAIMDKDYIKQAVDTMLEDESIGALGGRAYLWDDDNKLFDRTNDFYAYQNVNSITAEGIFTKHDLGVKQSVNAVSGSCVMVSKSVTEQVGYLHEPFFAYFEESDLFARMKRAGYKIIYQPSLAIWHANAKTTNKKSPTFFYYMIMRNRFRFAIRNFDSWSLRRFLNFYLKMGLVSVVKSLLPLKQRPMHHAYATAFFYNIVFGWRAFAERRQLTKVLGKSNYNQLIVREQTGISVIVACKTKDKLETLIDVARTMEPIDELLAITTDDKLVSYINSIKDKPYSLRLCVDRDYFKTHSQNIGAICSKNEWLILPDSRSIISAMDIFSNCLYYVKRSSKKLAYITTSLNSSFESSLHEDAGQTILIDRSHLIDAGGLDKSFSIENAKRQILAFSYLANKFFKISIDDAGTKLPKFSGGINTNELHKKLSAMLSQAKNEHKKPSLLDNYADRHYRFAQFRNLVIWLLHPRIPMRLKAGRTRNLAMASVKLDRSVLADELKHIRNEVMIYKDSVNLVALKDEEQKRLDYLQHHPDETVVFIILRDRFEPLKSLLRWLEAQGLKKIVFIDNDSRLPPLVELLNKTNYQVLEMGRNMTQTAPWSAGVIKVLLPDDFYIVSDPDIIPVRDEHDVVAHLYKIHSDFPHHIKVGLGLKIDDIPDYYPLKNEVIKWESQFWKNELKEGVYEAGVDTTFALYKPRTYKYALNPSLRTGEPYTARHLPWYSKKDELTDEEVFYRLRADQNVNSWNKDHLPERYKKELEKQR